MRLLIAIPALGNVYGGTSKSVIELAQSLGKAGIEVDIVTTNANGAARLDVPLKTWIGEIHYRIQYFPYWGVGDYKFSLSFAQWIFNHVQDYDLVQSHAIFSVPNLPVYWACQWHNIPYVVFPHGMLEPWALSYKVWKKRLYYKLFEQPALQRASTIQTLTTTEAMQVQSLGIETPTLVRSNGVRYLDYENLPTPEIFYTSYPEARAKVLILFLGRIDPKKGLDLLAKAFAKIHAQYAQTHLIVAGPDNIGFLPTAQHYFEQAGCQDAVTFTGMLEGELKYAALAAADLYVAPSYSEGFSMSILEGMASGLPCVITKGCNFPEAEIAQVAHVVDIDANAIADAILLCLANQQNTTRMGARARQFIHDHYAWHKIATSLSEAYTEIVAQHSSIPIPEKECSIN